jgi:hypothetical protein
MTDRTSPRHLAEQTTLDLMFGQITNYCPVISRNTIVKNPTSLDQIWQTIRLNNGFQFLHFNEIKLRPDERPEDLYQRLLAFIDDNLLKREGGTTHHSDAIDDDEEMTPTNENLIILTWLCLINSELPRLVKQRYGTELRSRTLASIKPVISQALPSLLEEIKNTEDAKAFRSFTFPKSGKQSKPPNTGNTNRQVSTSASLQSKSKRSCPFCKQVNGAYIHFLNECRHSYLRMIENILHVLAIHEEDECEVSDVESDTDDLTYSHATKVVSN